MQSANRMTVGRIEIRNFNSVDCFKARFKKGINVIDNEKVLEIILSIISGQSSLFSFDKADRAEPSYVRAQCSVGEECFYIEIVGTESGYKLNSPLPDLTELERRMCVYDCNNDWSKELYGYLNEDECYSGKKLMKLTGGASATHSFRAYLNRFVNDNKRNGTLNSRGVFINKNNIPKSEFQFECFKKMLEFWDCFNEIRSPNQLLMPVIISGIKKEKITLNRQVFVEGDCI